MSSTFSCTSPAIDLFRRKHVDVVIGALNLVEAALISHLKASATIISLSPSPPPSPIPPPPRFVQMSSPAAYPMLCAASVIGHFRWRKVILIHEIQSRGGSNLFAHLSDALRAVDSSVERHVAVPQAFIEKELKKLKTSSSVRIFVVAQSSLEFAAILFEKAKALGMMEKGYVWIVTDEVSNLLDSSDSSLLLNMQGVIALRTDYHSEINQDEYRAFRSKFRRKFASKYRSEEENLTPSIYSLRAYDSIFAIAKSLNESQLKLDPQKLILHTDFQGLSGRIAFKNGFLSQKPNFHILNVIGKSYREVALWSPEFGFSEDLDEFDGKRLALRGGVTGDLSSIYWPGGAAAAAPRGWSLGSREEPLKIGVPARGAFNQFVKVAHDRTQNRTQISGFSIDVFEAAVKQLPYDLYYEFVPYYGSYDEMVAEVHNKVKKH